MRIVRYDGPGLVRLAFHGELDLATVGLVDHGVTAALAGAPGRLVLDVSALTFCDSSGIDALLTARSAAEARGVACQVTGPRGIVRRSMAATGVLDLLTAG
ncbi:anti-anti-sigma factor [Actinoplanes octamycinicus]|uniref:Anti-anti-sigma factor n=1 Tax=Actinoplanes octamycinicus TaxID=135948 RepID=A0A7W7GYG5_9ACTN|nr:STAS domain-containing protein [Actinoplanes octamycinicus]MBB4740636.1 anti-anti-sigma factor [Actinoplanes octamycinicus]GIE63061.1 anti-sigma factor antagonist [Actinoplanes octamycinicus]